ncbi:MAG TPA: hypothetical protein VE890_00410 [Thermoguttaceae bacterium]|nr:hypothetical protein [Thermoguttaceae bacterium]
MKRKHLLSCLTVMVVSAIAIRSQAQVVVATDTMSAKAAEDKVPVTQLVLRPAGEPRQALKYRLLPKWIDRKSGNAAVIYNRCCLLLEENSDWEEDAEKLYDLFELPIAEIPLDEAKKLLGRYQYVLSQIALAAARDHCDWELFADEQDPITMMMPEISAIRGMARLLRYQASIQIIEGKLDEAIRTLQTGYALGRHMAEGPTLIHGLVGIAICGMMSSEVELLIQQPEAPNMYWALTALPRPLVDMRPGIEAEMNLLNYAFPELREVDDPRHGKAYWQTFSYRLADRFAKWGDFGMRDEPWKFQLMMAGMAIRGYPIARQALIDQGRPAAEVDAMPVPQVVAIYTLDTYNELRDEQFKWFMLPYHETRGRVDESQQRLREGMRREIIPLGSLLLPAISAAKFSVARNDRAIAMLRTIEAIRMDVADHDGRLPESLDDVEAVPVPRDPVTGEPFLYEKQGDTVLLKTAPTENHREKQSAKHFEIRFPGDR